MQKVKSIGTWFALIIALYILSPTVFHLKDTQARFTTEGKTLPWYYKIMPSQEMNLGLDLRGGLYIEMEVDVDDAMDHTINSLIADVRRFAFKDDLAQLSAERVGKNSIRVEVPADKINTLQDSLTRIFGAQQFAISTDQEELFFDVKGDAEAARKLAVESLTKLAGDPTKALNALFTADKKQIGVHFDKKEQMQSLTTLFATPEMSAVFAAATPKNLVYLKITDASLDKIKKDVIEQAAKSVRNRIDRFGVAEASVSRQGDDRLVIELPGAKDTTQIIDLVKTTGKLEFRLVNETLGFGALKALVDAKTKELALKTPFEIDNQKKLNAALKAQIPENTEILFSLDRDEKTNTVTSFVPYLVSTQADVTGDMLETANVQSQNGMPNVGMTFSKIGAQKFGEVTSKNVGRQLAIVLDNVVMSAPNIQGAIMGGEAQITLGRGSFQSLQDEAQDLALILKEGALPASLKVASKNIVGPSLGQDSIDAGIRSILISAALVIFFMLVYYRFGGIIANIALILNIILMFAILSLIGASLTLPGMAGIVLTMGMAVDANVIIFERMREERRITDSMVAIVEGAYNSAFSAIVDGNITTFIAGVFLFEYGTGAIKGFATTLMIGIVTTMFTAVVVTRLIYDWSISRFKMKTLGF